MNRNFDSSSPAQKAGKTKSSSSLTWNVLSVVMLLATVGLIYVFSTVFSNPYSNLNPFPPPTFTPTFTATAIPPATMAPTWTLTLTVHPTETKTPRPTFTLEPSNTPFILPTRTSAATAKPEATTTKTPKPAGSSYSASVDYFDSKTFIPTSSCDSLYVAGKVFDKSGAPVTSMQVWLGGNVPGKSFNPPLITLTGIATAYGASGFEFNPGIKPVASTKTLWVQLYSQSGTPLTDQIPLTTFTDCKKNLVLVQFNEK